MILCFICNCEVRSNKELLDHIHCVHPETQVFQCSEKRCSRTFSLLKSFRRHRYKFHASKNSDSPFLFSLPRESQESQVVNSDVESPEFIDTTISEGILSNNLQTENHSNSNDNDSDASVFDFDTFETAANEKTNIENSPTFESQLLIFVARLYDFLEIPRNKVNVIVNQLVNLMKFTVSSIEREVIENMQSEKSSVNTVADIFENFISPLKKFATEKHRLNEF